MRSLSTSVLVVGGGAVGLVLALELGRRGQQCIVVDEGDGTIEHPRTGGISVRTMEYCRWWGIADEVRGNDFPADYQLDNVFCTSIGGYELARRYGPSMANTPVPPESPERKVRCPQFWFDPMLSDAAQRQESVQVLRYSRLDRLVENTNGVLAEVHDVRTGEPFTVRADYLVGCDGPASTVRGQLGIEMSGNPLLNYSVNVLFRSPEMLKRTGAREAERFILVAPTGTWGNVTVVDGRSLWRLTVIGAEERLDLSTFDAAAHVRRAIGEHLDVDFEVVSVSPWRRTQLVADEYGRGRVFLCGDSLHTMSPTGGFGVNTGIGDAVDLAWKLDATLRGWGGSGLLASYEIERRPVGLRNAVAATANFKGWTAPDDLAIILDDTPAAERARRDAGEHLLAATHAEWESLGVILGYRYEGSPLCVPDGTPPTPDEYSRYVPTARPGSRAPHVWLPDGRSTLDLFGGGFVLLAPANVAASPDSAVTRLVDAARRVGLPLTVKRAPQDVIATYEEPLTLVRPDGHVAWRGRRPPDGLVDVVRGEVLGATAALSR